MGNIVMSLWINSEIDEMQLLCLKSFLERGHQFHLYSYGPITNLPKGIVLKDANEIIPERFVFLDRVNSYATFSDWFRIKLLYDVGGWWVDCDVLCIKKFEVDWPYVFATEVSRDMNGEEFIQICNAIIKMPKGSLEGKSILNRINRKLKNGNFNEIFWTEIGAKLIEIEISQRNVGEYIVAPDVFCPINFFNYKEILQGCSSLSADTYGVHLWNKMWEWNKENALLNPKKGSLLYNHIHKT